MRTQGPVISDEGFEARGNNRIAKILRTTLAGVVATTGGALAAIANPEGADVLITRAVLHLTTDATGAALADIGVAADGETSSDTLLDGVDIGTAAGVFDNIDDQGTNGQSVLVWGADEFVTMTGSADSSGLVGVLYIEYIPISAAADV